MAFPNFGYLFGSPSERVKYIGIPKFMGIAMHAGGNAKRNLSAYTFFAGRRLQLPRERQCGFHPAASTMVQHRAQGTDLYDIT